MTWGFVTCGPNEALVVSGCCHSKPLLVPGGWAFIWPTVHKIQRICLNIMTLLVDTPTVYTSQGIPISVVGIAQVKVGGQNRDLLRIACEEFLGKSQEEIRQIALVTVEGHQRAIMGLMTVEEICKDRKKFSRKVYEVASVDLVKMGITVVSYTLKDIKDEEVAKGYLKSLGMARIAEIKCAARIGEAEAKRDSQIKEAEAEEQRLEVAFRCNIDIAKYKRDYEIKKFYSDAEVQARTAEAELAYDLQAAKIKQLITNELTEIKVVEKRQQIALEEQEMARKEKELEATIKKPAEAERDGLIRLAEAEHNRIVLDGEAEAEAIRLKGDAEAFAIAVKAKAESEQMMQKTEAWMAYNDAAMIDMYLGVLPKIASEVAMPLTHSNRITMIAAGSGEVGVGKLTGEVLDIVLKIPQVVKDLTGVDLTKNIKSPTINV